jgi:hypothetical protein
MMQTEQLNATAEQFESKLSGFRYYGVRVEFKERKEGDVLPNSWHPVSECDWLTEDTELDGTCCFEVQDSVAATLRLAHSFWPRATGYSLIGSDSLGDAAPAGGLPEDGAILLQSPVVLAFVHGTTKG